MIMSEDILCKSRRFSYCRTGRIKNGGKDKCLMDTELYMERDEKDRGKKVLKTVCTILWIVMIVIAIFFTFRSVSGF